MAHIHDFVVVQIEKCGNHTHYFYNYLNDS